MAETAIITSQCEECKHGSLKEYGKIIKTLCELRPEKEYYFGQCITCECFDKKS